MTLKLMEEAVSVIKTYLSDNMAAKLDILDTEYDDFELDDIRDWYMAEVSAIPDYPAIFVLGDFTEVEGEGGGWLESDHQLTIVCFITDQDVERLRKRLYRYIRACIELLKTARGSEGWAYVINFTRADFSPIYGRGSTFLMDGRLIIRVKRYENE